MLDNPSRVGRLVKWAVGLLIFVVFAAPYLRDHSAQVRELRHQLTEQVREQYAEVLRSFQDDKKLFVADFLETGALGETVDGKGLSAHCASRTWFSEDKAVIVSCEPAEGGPALVRNSQLNCIRFAIEVGAQVVLPRTHTRHMADITKLRGGQQVKGLGLDYMFDQAHLVDALATHCPQLRVHGSLDALYDKPSLLKPLTVNVAALAAEQPEPGQLQTASSVIFDGVMTSILGDTASLRARLAAKINRDLAKPPARIHWPVRVHLNPVPQYAFPAAAGGAALRRDFGRLLRVRDDVRALGASALWNLAARHHNTSWLTPADNLLSVAPSPPQGELTTNPDAAFLAIHLRTEKDAVESNKFPNYDDQTAYFLDYLASLPPPEGWRTGERRVVYLATGLPPNDPEIRKFRESAADLNATVVMKRDLLDPGEVAVLDRLTFDQRALVEREIILRAGRVLGVVESAFMWDVALRRAEVYGAGGHGFAAKPVGEGALHRSSPDVELLKMWSDPFSILYGKSDEAVSVYLGTWP